MYKKAA